jgi:hypothetical protein
MDWKAWLSIVTAAVTSFGGPTAALAAMIANGILQLDMDVEANRALADKWFAFLKTAIVDEKREFTQAEHDEAKAFADEVHAAVQNG